VALGAKGLVLLPTLDRLVGFFAVYTRDRSLEDLTASLAIHVVRSSLGSREIALEFAAESSDRMDRIADTARLVGGYTLTGTSRHFVQYRDAAAPFGYDATELAATDASITVYHERVAQTYAIEQAIDLRALLLRLMPRVDPSARVDSGELVVVAAQGLGPALVQYLVRSHVEGEVCVVEWPPESAFDDAPVHRWILRIPELPPRIQPLLATTPGITCFAPVGPGIAVEVGYRHPVELRACPLFDPAGLVLLRGRGDDAWIVERVPPMGELTTFSHIELRPPERVSTASGEGPAPARLGVRLRVVPSSRPWRNVSATWIEPAQVPLLRRLAYVLPHSTVTQARIALTPRGALLRCPGGADGIPLGTFYVEVHPRVYIPAGHEIAPAVAPEVLARALETTPSQYVFIPPDEADGPPDGTGPRAVVIEESAFVPLESALLDAPPWEALPGEGIARSLDDTPIVLNVTSIGMLPLRGVHSTET
jgi:hypothetical protein